MSWSTVKSNTVKVEGVCCWGRCVYADAAVSHTHLLRLGRISGQHLDGHLLRHDLWLDRHEQRHSDVQRRHALSDLAHPGTLKPIRVSISSTWMPPWRDYNHSGRVLTLCLSVGSGAVAPTHQPADHTAYRGTDLAADLQPDQLADSTPNSDAGCLRDSGADD